MKVSLRGEFVDEDEGVVSYTGVTSSGVVKEDPKATTNSEFHPEDSHPYLMDTCHEDVDITGKPSAKVKGPHIVFLQHGFKGELKYLIYFDLFIFKLEMLFEMFLAPIK